MTCSADKRLTSVSIAVNSGSNILKLFVSMAIPFLMTPFYLRVLGDTIYGIWVVVLSIIGQMGLLEMGVQPAVTKLVAEYNSVNDYGKIRGVVSTAFLFYCVIGTLVILGCWIISYFFLSHLISDQTQIELAETILTLSGVIFALQLVSYVFGGMLLGIQKFHIKNFLNITLMIITNVTIYVFLSGGYGIVSLLVITLLSNLLTIFTSFIACKKLYAPFTLSLSHISKSSFSRLFGFASKVFTSASLRRIAYNADVMIISYYLSPAMATVFSIPQRLLRHVQEMVWALTAVFLPVFSHLDKKNDLKGLQFFYLNYSRYLIIIVSPILAALTVYGLPFISIWVGETYAQEGKFVFFILLGYLFIQLLQPLDFRLFIGTDKLKVVVRLSALSSALNITLSLVLIQNYGINGIAFATLVSYSVLRIFLLFFASRYYGIGVGEYFRSSLILPLMSSVVFALAMFVVGSEHPCQSYLQILFQVVICLPIYLITTYLFSLNTEERQFAVAKVRTCSRVPIRKVFRETHSRKVMNPSSKQRE